MSLVRARQWRTELISTLDHVSRLPLHDSGGSWRRDASRAVEDRGDRRGRELKKSEPGPLPLLRDRIKPGVRVLFVGINPGLRSALTGHHFAGFSNRFWKLLFDSRLVPERIAYEDDVRLPEWGFGITNIVARPTAGIDALEPREYVEGFGVLAAKGAAISARDRGAGRHHRVQSRLPPPSWRRVVGTADRADWRVGRVRPAEPERPQRQLLA